MTLREAIARFLEHSEESVKDAPQSFALLTACFSPDTALDEITPANLRDFLARWYIEQASPTSEADHAIEAQLLCDALAEFFRWAESGAEEHLHILAELRQSLLHALEISASLSQMLAERGGAFGFPEFLTSFEAGGHSSYDLDEAGEVGAIEGYFRITRIEGAMIEAEEVITEERVWPIIFPRDLASRLTNDYIINLELVRSKEGWQIAACGFAYPPGTDI
ncbi:MAG TPA: hypothetical protein VJX74_05650 [Blastocatellia bacterium]|nr:hypothetical protein [Blastocatellia bacterium]